MKHFSVKKITFPDFVRELPKTLGKLVSWRPTVSLPRLIPESPRLLQTKNLTWFSGEKATTILVLALSAIILVLALRGLPGNPTSQELNNKEWKLEGPFESSNDSGRFALLYSFVEDHSLSFSLPLAQFAVPDLAINERGQYVSLFAPGVSFLLIPGYLFGKIFGLSQVGTYAEVVLFAFLNLLLIRAIAIRLGAHPIAATLAGLVFVFATPAFTYAVSISQHHISTFLILLGIYLLIRYHTWLSLAAIWFLCALSIVVDNPNLFLMFPLGAYTLWKGFFTLKKQEHAVSVTFRPLYLATFASMAIPIAFFMWFNAGSQGDPLRLSGTLQRVILPGNVKIQENFSIFQQSFLLSMKEKDDRVSQETPVNFFDTRNLYNGFYTHIFSANRGVVYFTPVVLLGIFGLIILYRREKSIASLLLMTIGVNVLLYSMWGDPWGGWSFGSRYLIPSYALLSLALAFALTEWRQKKILLAVFAALFVYSVGVNTLGALTTNSIPPESEVLALEKLTGTVQKYTYAKSWDYLHLTGSKSFVYQTFARTLFTPERYYWFLTTLIVLLGVYLLFVFTRPTPTKRN